MSANKAEVKFSIPDAIYSNQTYNGSCTVLYASRRPSPCNIMMKIRVKPNSPNEDACSDFNQLSAKNWLATGCKGEFTIRCSKSNVSIDLQCLHSSVNLIKKINGNYYLEKCCSHACILASYVDISANYMCV